MNKQSPGSKTKATPTLTTTTSVITPATSSEPSPRLSTPQQTSSSAASVTSEKVNVEDISEKAATMDNARQNTAKEESVGLKSEAEPTNPLGNVTGTAGADADPNKSSPQHKKIKKRRTKCKRHSISKHDKAGSKKASRKEESSSDESDSSSDDLSTESDSEEDTESESETDKEKRRRRRRKEKAKLKKKKAKKAKRRNRKYESDSSSDESSTPDSETESDSEDEPRRRRRRSKRSRKAEETESEDEDAEEDYQDDTALETSLQAQVAQLQDRLAQLQLMRQQAALTAQQTGLPGSGKKNLDGLGHRKNRSSKSRRKSKKKNSRRASTLEYKRVDEIWSSSIHNYTLTESAENQVDEFDEYVFTVRRKFDWENKYRNTVVDIKSKLLRDALQDVMKDVKGVSLVEDQPSIDPNMLFLYLEEIKACYRKTLRSQLKREKKRKAKKRLSLQISHLKLLARYLDEDYEETKKTLYPMLKAGNITFELLWALFKPNTIAYTPTYGSVDDPRCFKVDYANKESSFIRGEWYCIEGRYLEYDGKHFGLGDFEVHIEAFKGSRKISSLASYPLQYHKDPEGLRKQLIDRGKRFVSMQGMNYRFHKGLAFQKKKKAVAKININGRVMIDPAIFRRINPNYPISLLKSKDSEEDPMNPGDESDECSDCCGGSSDEETGPAEGDEGPLDYGEDGSSDRERTRAKVIFDKDDKAHVVQVPIDEDGQELRTENFDTLAMKDGKSHQFTEEELLIASPVVLGFAFSEKQWLEFSLSGIRDITWNDTAFSSLVLPPAHKSIVKGMVSSHKFHAAETIDDVVQGKGRGLVFVLHGPPGVGKTLTAEGIAEYLRCPLYAVSAGELGTDSRMLEHELQKIMDIAHSWGAVLLLDEADVFLERREVHDIHRNALVSIFLRLLEYFQGILFLTTNRVETFDDAFQSRIHMPLRYGELGVKARREIWRTFVGKVGEMEGVKGLGEFREKDFDALAKNNLNGRQIKNAVRTAQSLAISEKERFSMEHIKRALDVSEDFDHQLKGGTGYLDAMRSYT